MHKTKSANASQRQRTQQRLVKKAMTRPGVAEVIEVYGSFQKYSGNLTYQNQKLKYATGGNSGA